MTTTLSRGTARAISIAAVAFATLAMTTLGSTAANAATPTAKAVAGQSCWDNVATWQTGCFATGMNPYQQISEATGTNVVAVPTAGGAAAGARAAFATPHAIEGAATSYILTNVWSSTNETGDAMTYFTTNSTVCVGGSYGFPSLGSWNDRIQSFQSFNGCVTTLYHDSNYGGTHFGPQSLASTLGSFNNQASSLVASD
jgi:hypothetical protein